MTLRETLLKQAAHNKRVKRIALDVIGDTGEALKVEVEIRSPTVAQANLIASADDDRRGEAVAQALIQCCFDPESGQPVFQPTDTPFILDQSPSSWVGVLLKEITELTQTAQLAAKN